MQIYYLNNFAGQKSKMTLTELKSRAVFLCGGSRDFLRLPTFPGSWPVKSFSHFISWTLLCPHISFSDSHLPRPSCDYMGPIQIIQDNLPWEGKTCY